MWWLLLESVLESERVAGSRKAVSGKRVRLATSSTDSCKSLLCKPHVCTRSAVLMRPVAIWVTGRQRMVTTFPRLHASLHFINPESNA